MTFSRAKYSHCETCPLRDEKRVWGHGPKGAKIVFVGEAPGEKEAATGQPFIGRAGVFLTKALVAANIFRDRCWFTNTISCRPPGNEIDSPEAEEAMSKCRAGFLKEIEELKKNGAKVFAPLGGTSSRAFNVPESITKARGSVYVFKDIPVVPTFHPSFIMRGQVKQESTWVADLIKVKDIAEKGWKPPLEKFILVPTIEKLERWVEKAIAEQRLLAVDIETTGLNPDYARIVVVGLARSATEAISVPFIQRGDKLYWKNGDNARARALLERALNECPTMYQNAVFDVKILRANGFQVKAPEHDILLLHHAIHPELPHKLGYIVSIYGETPYWKEGFSTRDGSILQMENDELRTYNLRDCVVLHQVLPGMIKDAKELGVYDTYRGISMKLIDPVLEMITTGLPISLSRLVRWKKDIEKKLEEAESYLRALTGVPEQFNFASGDDLRLLFFGAMPSKVTRAFEDMKKYEAEGSKLRKNTKKYKEVEERIGLAKSMAEPLIHPIMKVRCAAMSGKSLDEEAVVSLKIAATNRLFLLKNLKKFTDSHVEEKKRIETLVKALEGLLRYREASTLRSRYTAYPIGQDGRVHAEYRPNGTVTGRLASGQGEEGRKEKGDKVNAQNIPEEARKIFVAPKGNVLVNADYSNLELRVIGALSNDDVLLETFARGENVHDVNTRDMFGIDNDDPLWDSARRAAKIYIFGRNYGGGTKGIYERVMRQVTDLPITYNQFCAVDSNYRARHPKYVEWATKTVREVIQTKTLRNAFGRIRVFLGTIEEIQREGLNFPIQCLGFGTKVLTKDLRWVPVETVLEGDKLISLSEEKIDLGGKAKGRRWEIAEVTSTKHDKDLCYRVVFDDGQEVVATGEHKWLGYIGTNKRNGSRWIRTDSLKPGKTIIPVYFKVWEEDTTHDSGYVAGAYDSDGCLYQTGTAIYVSFCQKKNEVVENIWRILKEKGFTFAHDNGGVTNKSYTWTITRVKGGIPETLRFLGQFKPLRLLNKLDVINLSKRVCSRLCKERKVISVTEIGIRDIVRISTSTKTFFAEGMATHNSTAADIINKATIEFFKRKNDEGMKAKLIAQVHDALLVECPEGEKDRVVGLLKETMAREMKIGKYVMSFPVDVKVGKDWLNMTKIKE